MRSAHGNDRRLRPAGREDRSRRGFTFAEVVISVLIAGGMLVASLGAVAACRRAQFVIVCRSQGQLLAQGMMSEILQHPYEDPRVPSTFGRESGESPSNRANWNDVDDYDGWSASPPQHRHGEALNGFDRWRRSVAVRWADPADLESVSAVPTGVKRIEVNVDCGDLRVASAVAIRTEAWPNKEQLRVLFVVTDVSAPTAKELARRTLMESWGFTVTLINANSPQADFDTATAGSHMAYVSTEIDPLELASKLKLAAVGVVNEEPELVDDFGLATTYSLTSSNAITVADVTHYITAPCGIGKLGLLTSSAALVGLSGPVPPGRQALAKIKNTCFLAAFEAGAELCDGSPAAGRRVHLPWGDNQFDISLLTEDGKALMRRTIEWGAKREQP